ncbi:MAG TPA: hypothetical protein QGH28_02550 [Chloroflexota bacterium]|nr:hypothetical protein [Chloroflexota bacterium]
MLSGCSPAVAIATAVAATVAAVPAAVVRYSVIGVVAVISIVVDSVEDVNAMIEHLGLESPVVGEIDRDLVIQRLDAYPLDRRQSFHPVNVIFDADGAVEVASGAIGRIGVEEDLRFLI